jgi:putative tryptophan/tyrosine transport system substrate-binding protein
MRRRAFITLLGGAGAWPLAAHAQQAATPVIGYIGAQSRGMYVDRLRTFHEGLDEAGFVEGRNVAIEYRWAENHYDVIPGFLAELIARRVAVIALPDSTAGAIAAKGMTSTIPVVFGISGDPVQLGLVNSWNRPGGNVTGMVLGNAEIVPKRVALIRELVPAVTTVGLLVNPASTATSDIKFGQEAARKLGLQLYILNATTESEIATTIGNLARRERRALVVGSDTLFFVHRERVAALAAQHALPAIYDRREYAQVGGLISYGASVLVLHRRVGMYVGRVLKGEKPADLPVMLPEKFELAINLKTAKALGLSVPPTLLAVADEVIE